MEKLQFNNIVTNPHSLDHNTLEFLKKISKKYPYCQTAHIILAKNIESFDKLEYEKQVNMASVYAVDRKKFLRYLSEKDKHNDYSAINQLQEKKSNKPLEDKKTKFSTEQLQEIVNRRLAEIEKNKNSFDKSKSFNKGSGIYYSEESKKESENVEKGETNYKKSTDIIIENFIKNMPRITPSKGMKENNIDLSRESVSENDDIVSETIAEIYYKQGQKRKAILVYEKLSLKFPEKSSYFAKRIIDIQKETNLKQ